MSNAISAQAVAQLREKTGLGLMQCKKALTETGGDIEAAIELLRKQGAAVAAKRSDRETKEGKVVFGRAGSSVSAVEINCETDFVASSDDFVAFADKAAQAVAAGMPADLDAVASLSVDGGTLADANTAVIAKIGEKITIRRFAVETVAANEVVETYSHMGGKIGVLIKLAFEGTPSDTEALGALAKDLAMQVAASAPLSIDPSGIPAEIVAKEREIARELTEKEGKTGDMLERIVEGKVNKFFKENCLLQQVFVKDNKTPIDKLLADSAKKIGVENLRVAAFHRLQLGQ
ncbi:MAG TPA: translation elongation factor Ts [Fibrobacteria bacterium]|jgi:elongation factor Ts|nr:translation elongation factor Ts [Fibrobacteria bacterium]